MASICTRALTCSHMFWSHTEQVLPKLVELLEARVDRPWLFEATVDDNQQDSDEYDTEWSSIDVVVAKDRASVRAPAARCTSTRC